MVIEYELCVFEVGLVVSLEGQDATGELEDLTVVAGHRV